MVMPSARSRSGNLFGTEHDDPVPRVIDVVLEMPRQYGTVTMLAPLGGAASVALAGSEIPLPVSFTSSAAAGARYPAVRTLIPAPEPPLVSVDETLADATTTAPTWKLLWSPPA